MVFNYNKITDLGVVKAAFLYKFKRQLNMVIVQYYRTGRHLQRPAVSKLALLSHTRAVIAVVGLVNGKLADSLLFQNLFCNLGCIIVVQGAVENHVPPNTSAGFF